VDDVFVVGSTVRRDYNKSWPNTYLDGFEKSFIVFMRFQILYLDERQNLKLVGLGFAEHKDTERHLPLWCYAVDWP
jgi:hypothetical protein